ncbi:MAG: hypothetical protein ACLSAP_07685 [Oscillospiraceae bacterium]
MQVYHIKHAPKTKAPKLQEWSAVLLSAFLFLIAYHKPLFITDKPCKEKVRIPRQNVRRTRKLKIPSATDDINGSTE